MNNFVLTISGKRKDVQRWKMIAHKPDMNTHVLDYDVQKIVIPYFDESDAEWCGILRMLATKYNCQCQLEEVSAQTVKEIQHSVNLI
jgi:hypothetical protein